MPKLPNFYYEQMSRPHGQLARIAAWLMTIGNRVINRQAVAALHLQPADHVLDVGFGGGAGLSRLLPVCAAVGGVDPSESMVAYCRRRFDDAVQSGQVDLRLGFVEALPWDDGTFDKVLAVNTIYFWEDLEKACSEIHRVVRQGGRVVIATSSAATCRWFRWPERGYFVPDEDVVMGLLEAAGFLTVRVEVRRNLGGTRLFIAEK